MVPWNRFLDSLKVLKFGLRIQFLGIDSWALKSLKIRSQVAVSRAMVTAASEQVLETAVAVGVNHQTQAFTGKFQHIGIFFPVADSYNFIEVFWHNLECS